MGYEVHITRAAEWVDADLAPITIEEWIAYVRSDPEMRLDAFAEASTTDGASIRVESPGVAVWTAWPAEPGDGGFAWFDHRGGWIVVENPDQAILAKALAIAERLGATVQGDDGELYAAPEAPPIDAPVDALDPAAPRRWWHRLTRR